MRASDIRWDVSDSRRTLTREVAGRAQGVSKVTGSLISFVTIWTGSTRSVSFVKLLHRKRLVTTVVDCIPVENKILSGKGLLRIQRGPEAWKTTRQTKTYT